MDYLDRLVCATTGFASWDAMVDALSTGYVPTIYPKSRRARLLAKLVSACGFRHWPHGM